MKVGSLATGSGGLEMAIKMIAPAWSLHWVAETDHYANKVLACRFPDTPNIGDVTQIAQTNPISIDVLVGGLPCQPFSVAGKKGGESDERNLLQHLPGIVRSLEPRLVLLENVSRLVTQPEWRKVVGELSEIGYDATWTTFRASDVGAPHRRERLFAVAHPHGEGGADVGRGIVKPVLQPKKIERPEGRGHSDLRARGKDFGPAIRQWESITGVPVPPLMHGRAWCPRFGEWMMGWPIGWVSSVVSPTQARKLIGNGVVPLQAAWAFYHLITGGWAEHGKH